MMGATAWGGCCTFRSRDSHLAVHISRLSSHIPRTLMLSRLSRQGAPRAFVRAYVPYDQGVLTQCSPFFARAPGRGRVTVGIVASGSRRCRMRRPPVRLARSLCVYV